MARRSATECAAILDVSQRLRLVTDSAFTAARELLIRIVSMLVRTVRSLDGQAQAVTAIPEPTKAGTGTLTGPRVAPRDLSRAGWPKRAGPSRRAVRNGLWLAGPREFNACAGINWPAAPARTS